MNLKITIIAIICLISGVLSAQEMLSPYLETAAKNNPGLKARFSEYMASLEVVPQVGTLPDPQLAFGYFILPVETRNGPQRARISLTQMFPWFGTLNAREEVAINKAKVKYESFEDFKSNLFFEVKATYYDLYFIKKGIDITLDNIRILGSFKNLALIKIEAGKASGVDEIRIEMELADLENNLALLKDKWNIAKVKFNNLLNVGDGSEVAIPDSLWSDDLPYSRQDVLDSLRLNNHQILKFDYLLESYRENERLARKTGLPAMSVGIDYIVVGKTDNAMIDQGNSGRDAILFPKIGITIPLYRKKYTAMVNEALYMQDATVGEREEKINSLEVLFERAYYEYIDGQRRISLYLKQKNYAHKAISILETEYATNGKNFEEILRMEKRLLTYSLELEKAYSDKQASIAFINYLIGE
ncbi:MAG: TolC family protein [Bacteroidales bacterium]|nr:TolC family protein [Bacteroidales bacterium]